jgi:DNA polymerase III epsilon subunit-like protein
LRSGATIASILPRTAESKNYLTRQILNQLHLQATGDPIAFSNNPDGSVVFYFDSDSVIEAPPEFWYYPSSKSEEIVLPSGSVISKMSVKHAATLGFYTAERLQQMNCEPIEEPVGFTYRNDKSVLYFYDKKTALRLPLMCIKCGKAVRFKRKLCEQCYNEDLAVRRAEGDAHRNAFYEMDRNRVLFFDLELTGFYDRDEIISISILNGANELVMNTLVKPSHTKKWKKTEKIHGITPEMVQDSPELSELVPQIKELFENADAIIAYGVSTDFSHIKYIYETEDERETLHKKIRCCANEFVRYIHEHRPDVLHASLTDAMECLGIDWDGIPHSSIADTYACAKVWNTLFPNYYKN